MCTALSYRIVQLNEYRKGRRHCGKSVKRKYLDKQTKNTLIYKIKLFNLRNNSKPVWTYSAQLWDTGHNSSIEILQRLQNKILQEIVNAPLITTNTETQTIYTYAFYQR